jgi:hypothetical protein
MSVAISGLYTAIVIHSVTALIDRELVGPPKALISLYHTNYCAYLLCVHRSLVSKRSTAFHSFCCAHNWA